MSDAVIPAPPPPAPAPVQPPASAPPARGMLSPLNRRRLANFRAHRRGWWSLWIFLTLFIVSLCAEFIANDRPILIRYEGKTYFPVVFSYPETAFGGEFETEADYTDPYVVKLIKDAGGWIVWPPIRYSYRTIRKDSPVPAPAPPTWLLSDEQCRTVAEQAGGTTCRDIQWNWLGTDDNSRDVLARLIYGFRLSVTFGLLLTLVSSVIGIAAGAVQGYFGGWVDLVGQRLIEIWSSLPSLYILIILAAVFTPGFWTLLLALMLFSWTALVGLVRAEFLRGRNLEYVRAARALGLPGSTIMWKHILPNAMVATLTFLPFIMNGGVSTLTALDYLGFGLPPGSASLGEMLSQGKNNLQAPWLGITGFMVLAVMLSLLVFIGEGVRDALDPRKTFR